MNENTFDIILISKRQQLESSQYLFLILINSMQLGLIYIAPNQNSNHLEVPQPEQSEDPL